MNWRRAAWAGILVLPVVILFALALETDPRGLLVDLRGQQAPDFTLPTATEGTLTLSDLRGQAVLINFWASWCEPCKAEHSLLQEAARAYAGEVAFIGVLYQDDSDDARAFLRTRPSPFPQLLDTNGRLGVEYGIAGVPETYFLSPEHRIQAKVIGPLSPQILQTHLAELIAP